MLDSNSLLFTFCILAFVCALFCVSVNCCVLQMRSSNYSTKWCGFLSGCLCLSVSLSVCLCMTCPSCRLVLCLVFFFPTSLLVCVFLSCVGSQSRGCLSRLSVTGQYMSALIVSVKDTNIKICAPKWTLNLTLSVSFLFPRPLSALAEVLRIKFMGMEHYYSFCCA